MPVSPSAAVDGRGAQRVATQVDDADHALGIERVLETDA
jgi:hypothetical protein